MSRTTAIQRLNDALRSQLTGGRLMLTPGVSQLAPLDRLAVLNLMRDFSAFTPDNDPHGEHDFGSVEHKGTRYFWKIDYYDLQLAMHSPDPADPAVTVRVLTLMRADEY
ncbi:hypothetical protein LNAOJCKE_4858 [Methylorubrum aminovorans]|jgi:hypothetical protein|uniref:DUF3768 domain-containing protein n=2 Tax=Methylorubrum TaxID=2282523 RepID=A0AA40VDK6_9HYPH|nr:MULTISPECIES: DUF3768 domain-containing protein [Methylorubrum]MBA8916047.1 hypothetical protein [Methylorubrum thiocyanatum]UGB28623.1 DUF3768 domain-containing protein [Methylorubrum sp. B1-46]GJE67626.1 hypothetical protein LNAOJCKE_4858 [Methylorubrum aminovorans]GJE82238.1 hypothetical protein CJNNKLLH_3601 [Methylorubrum thiocyanatum]GMA80043.1 hypothetical protein GCM10025880_64600 [Methylorubrum aminovorans]